MDFGIFPAFLASLGRGRGANGQGTIDDRANHLYRRSRLHDLTSLDHRAFIPLLDQLVSSQRFRFIDDHPSTQFPDRGSLFWIRSSRIFRPFFLILEREKKLPGQRVCLGGIAREVRGDVIEFGWGRYRGGTFLDVSRRIGRRLTRIFGECRGMRERE